MFRSEKNVLDILRGSAKLTCRDTNLTGPAYLKGGENK
jgi:hypothetical protein